MDEVATSWVDEAIGRHPVASGDRHPVASGNGLLDGSGELLGRRGALVVTTAHAARSDIPVVSATTNPVAIGLSVEVASSWVEEELDSKPNPLQYLHREAPFRYLIYGYACPLTPRLTRF